MSAIDHKRAAYNRVVRVLQAVAAAAFTVPLFAVAAASESPCYASLAVATLVAAVAAAAFIATESLALNLLPTWDAAAARHAHVLQATFAFTLLIAAAAIANLVAARPPREQAANLIDYDGQSLVVVLYGFAIFVFAALAALIVFLQGA